MPYPRNSPLKDKGIRHMTVSACYAEIALAAGGEWNPSRLEELIDESKYGDRTGRYRRMARGIVPRNKTASQIRGVLGDSCDILKWRDHLFWKLLMLRPLSQNETEEVLLSIRSNVTKHIWGSDPHDIKTQFRHARREPTRETIDAIANHRSFDALLALIAIARDARNRGILDTYYPCALTSLEVFPHVVGNTPQLYICWKAIAERLRRLVWEPNADFFIDVYADFNLHELEMEIQKVSEATMNNGVSFPPLDILERHNRIIE